MAYRPLSIRDERDVRFDGPQEGLPDYMLQPVLDWLDPLLHYTNHQGFRRISESTLKSMQVAMRLQPPLDWTSGSSAIKSLRKRMASDRQFALDVLDYFVQHRTGAGKTSELAEIFESGGSEWEIVTVADDRRVLARRVVGPVKEAVERLQLPSERAHHHLSVAWERLVGRSPDPSAVYREAIKAVEAAAKPVVTPNDPLATLGKIIAALRAKPEKWVTSLDKSSPTQIADMADLIWKGQLDRHGTDDKDAPLNVSQDEADSAFHVALAVVRLFVSGGIRAKN